MAQSWHEIIGTYTSPDKDKVILIYQGPGHKIGIANAAYTAQETNKEANTSQQISLSTTAALNMIETMRNNQWTRS